MDFKQAAKELVSKMTFAEKMTQMQYNSPAIPRLGIPAYNWWGEALHGVARAGTATVFPQAIGMAASFNAPLMHEVATAISDEARAKYNEYKTFGDTEIYQGLSFWSPNINIFRDPRWGRGHETYGEDPYLTGTMGEAFVKGLQGEGKYRKVDATLKHYAVHSGPESERHSFDARVSDRDLYETYLWAFRYIIEKADPSAVMGSYNRINGEPACGSPTMLTKILRGEFGFKGYVTSDCGAICDFNLHHHVTETYEQSAALAVKNGCDLNCGSAYTYLTAAAAEGLITEEDVTVCVERLYEARFRLGMFAEDCEYDKITMDVVDSPAHRALNRRMAQESMVLLKNNGILPLRGNKKIAVIGPNADSREVLIANYFGTPSRYQTLLRGMLDGAPDECEIRYAEGCHLYQAEREWDPHLTREAILAARWADVVVLCMGLDPRMEGEEGDCYSGADSGDKLSLLLPEVQRKLFSAIAAEKKPMVFVNVSGSCVALRDADSMCDAVLQCFYPGAEGGNALADILFGKVSPSGRLPVTFYADDKDLPDFRDYSMENRTYRFFEGTPLYPFGHGLSYGDIIEEWTDENTCVVTNNAGMDTEYAVLRYEKHPYPTLCGYKKVTVPVGKSVKVVFA